MNYLDQIATRIAEVEEPGYIPGFMELPLYRTYAVLLLAKGEDVTLTDVHNAWAAHESMCNPDHPSIRPFDELSLNAQEYDRPFVEAIQAVAREYLME